MIFGLQKKQKKAGISFIGNTRLTTS